MIRMTRIAIRTVTVTLPGLMMMTMGCMQPPDPSTITQTFGAIVSGIDQIQQQAQSIGQGSQSLSPLRSIVSANFAGQQPFAAQPGSSTSTGLGQDTSVPSNPSAPGTSIQPDTSAGLQVRNTVPMSLDGQIQLTDVPSTAAEAQMVARVTFNNASPDGVASAPANAGLMPTTTLVGDGSPVASAAPLDTASPDRVSVTPANASLTPSETIGGANLDYSLIGNGDARGGTVGLDS